MVAETDFVTKRGKLVESSLPQPFLTTHLANIALNKQLGLVFVCAERQETIGLSDVSEESLLNDQLAVAKWMILNFLFDRAEKEVDPVEPWIWIGPYRVNLMEVATDKELLPYDRALAEIKAVQLQLTDSRLWGPPAHPRLVSFLLQLVEQIKECERYTNRRVELIKLCHQLGLAKNDEAANTILLSHGPETAQELIDSCQIIPGAKGVAAMGYLAIKNSMPAASVFARRLVPIVQSVITDEAIKRGYAKPAETVAP